MKQSLGANTYLFPLPAVVVGSYDSNDQPNMMTASWTGVVNSDPAMVAVSLRKATYSYNSLLEKQAFTISIPSKDHIIEMDYVGTLSGRKRDKFSDSGLTAVRSELVDAPYVAEFPVVLECRLVKADDLGLHTQFVAEVVDVKIDADCLRSNGMPDIDKLAPIAYAHGDREYYELGEYLGPANRLWQASLLNPKYTEEEQEVVGRIRDYYDKLDSADPLEAFDDFFPWDDFQIVNGEQLIDSRDKYAAWYQGVNEQIFDRKHILEKLALEKLDDGSYKATIEMHFRARTRQPGQGQSRKVEVRGDIEQIFIRDKASGLFVIKRYTVVEK